MISYLFIGLVSATCSNDQVVQQQQVVNSLIASQPFQHQLKEEAALWNDCKQKFQEIESARENGEWVDGSECETACKASDDFIKSLASPGCKKSDAVEAKTCVWPE